jgi:diadenosine tetraphosphate (Ap4A) HIT family hydrolase
MSWKDEQRWQAMISGTDCPMCHDIHEIENQHSYLICELEESYVRLPKNQDPHGLVLVALKRHATEMYELGDQERDRFFKDVAKAAKAVKEVFEPIKIYYGIFEGRCPHFHCHIIPQYKNDDPYAPLSMNQKKVTLEDKDYAKIIRNLKDLIQP